jgi:hypothetical protein
MPPEVVAKIHQEVVKALKSDQVAKSLGEQGFIVASALARNCMGHRQCCDRVAVHDWTRRIATTLRASCVEKPHVERLDGIVDPGSSRFSARTLITTSRTSRIGSSAPLQQGRPLGGTTTFWAADPLRRRTLRGPWQCLTLSVWIRH